MLHLKDVTKTYPNGHTALRDVNLHVPAGQALGVIGESGAGKSTLVRLLAGLEVPTSGEVRLNGRDLAALGGREGRAQRRQVGLVFQHFNLLAQRTAAQNVALPLELAGVPRREREERAARLLSLVGLDGLESRYPAQLSGGQKQRVGIARALANDPALLIADEATSALDPATSASVLRLLRELQARTNLTLVVVTHELHVVRDVCTHAAVLAAGELVEHGLVREVLSRPREAATRALVNAHEPRVDLAPDERLVRFTWHGPLSANLPWRLAELGVHGQLERVERHRTAVGEWSDVWLLLQGSPDAVRRAERALLALDPLEVSA